MTEAAERWSPTRPRPDEELLCEFQRWEARLPTPATLWDALRTCNSLILDPFIMREFGKLAKEAARGRQRLLALRDLTIAATGDLVATERFLRLPLLTERRSPMEAAVESDEGMDEALLALTPHLRSVAMRIFSLLERTWSLDEAEAAGLLGSSKEQLARWRTDPSVIPRVVVERISLLLTIYKALGTLFSGQEPAETWVKRPNSWPRLGGGTALNFMIVEGVVGIRLVRDYLEAQIWGQ